MVTPDYYERFKCVGGACRHNCCRGGWEIEVDSEALDRFKALPGEFGDRVRAAVGDGGVIIPKNGECPILTRDGLCDMALRGIELCAVCNEYPRFTESWEDYTERGISLSCEAAADIIINSKSASALIGTSGECRHPLFLLLYAARERIFGLLRDGSMDIYKRLRLALDYADKLQARINDEDYEAFEYEPTDRFTSRADIGVYLSFIGGLEVLAPDWPAILEGAGKTGNLDDSSGERLALYFVYRYFLKAAYDCAALDKMKFAALSVLAIDALPGDLEERARRYSIEIEHDEDNIEAIYDEFLFGEEFSLENVVNMCCK